MKCCMCSNSLDDDKKSLVGLVAEEDNSTAIPSSGFWRHGKWLQPVCALTLCWEMLCLAHDDTNLVHLLTNKLQGLTLGVESMMGGSGKILLSEAQWFIVFTSSPCQGKPGPQGLPGAKGLPGLPVRTERVFNLCLIWVRWFNTFWTAHEVSTGVSRHQSTLKIWLRYPEDFLKGVAVMW